MSSGLDEDVINFDAEGRKLLGLLNLSNEYLDGKSLYGNLDAIWRHPETGAMVYVGNQTAARSLVTLQKHQITRVVNCTADLPNYHASQEGIEYHRFDVSHLAYTSYHRPEMRECILTMFAFVEKALSEGQSVLVHCLAGAHRAGATGISLLMHFGNYDHNTALLLAKTARPIIQPIGRLVHFLDHLDIILGNSVLITEEV